MDVVKMPACRGKSCLVVARDDFSGWVEAKAFFIAVSETVSKFLWEDVICRYSMFDKLIVDWGPENKGLVEGLVKKFGINRIITSAYHPEVNGMIERGYQSTANGLAKMTEGGLGKWVDNLPAVL
jgi:hypothetical protein